MAACPGWPLWALALDPQDGEIRVICDLCNSTLRPLPGNRQGDGGLYCPNCPSAQWEVDE